jgi:methylase of polypeptide subunit release factors
LQPRNPDNGRHYFAALNRMHLFPYVFGLCVVVVATSVSSSSLNQLYRHARQTRITSGSLAAQLLYEDILKLNPADITTSTRLAAAKAPASLERMRKACQLSTLDDYKKLEHLRNWFSDVNYSSDSVGTILNASRKPRAPIYVTPASPGSVERLPFPPAALTTCHCLTSLFLLGLCVSVSDAKRCFSDRIVQLLKDIGLICHCDYNHDLLYAVVSIVPIDLPGNLTNHFDTFRTTYIVTDWHPLVLNTIKIHEDEEAVMYVGPDSLALIEHWILHPNLPTTSTLLDLCTGSGVQAIFSILVSKCKSAVCVDINPRALRFCFFSAALNGVSQAVTLIQGDLMHGTGTVYSEAGVRMYNSELQSLIQLLQHGSNNSAIKTKFPFGMVTANPPFLPVPAVCGPADRYGLFSSGGKTGEDVTAAILALSNSVLKKGGFIAIVSEFFFRHKVKDHSYHLDDLKHRFMSYLTVETEKCTESTSHKALLLTNEVPISASLYAERRADSKQEAVIWKQHLDQQRITSCSPGLLFVQKRSQSVGSTAWLHAIVPKSELGSIWTPSNENGISFSHAKSQEFFDFKQSTALNE